MFAIVGLGNPGSRYVGTRHNIGFAVVEELSRRAAGAEAWQKKDGSLLQKVRIQREPALLILPQQFMNLSGQAAAPVLRFFKVEPENTVVIFDELDLEPGMIRAKQGGSAAGHRGVLDMARHVSAEDFFRIRVGIGHPRRPGASMPGTESGDKVQQEQALRQQVPIDVSSWVLGRPGPEEKELLDKAVLEAADAVEVLLKDGLKEVQNKFHRKQVPQ